MTNYLRFPDENTFRSAAYVAGFYYNEPEGDNPGGNRYRRVELIR